MMYLKINNSHLTDDFLKTYGNGDVFVETGTYKGDTVVLALESGYKQVYSTELDDKLFADAESMFQHRSDVKILHGDSVDTLKQIINALDGPATFWLDAHASGPLPGGKSGGSPVLDELRIIKEHACKDHTIFIDDVRLFGSAEWSFVKEQDAVDILMQINPNYKIFYLDGHIESDILVATIK